MLQQQYKVDTYPYTIMGVISLVKFAYLWSLALLTKLKNMMFPQINQKISKVFKNAKVKQFSLAVESRGSFTQVQQLIRIILRITQKEQMIPSTVIQTSSLFSSDFELTKSIPGIQSKIMMMAERNTTKDSIMRWITFFRTLHILSFLVLP